MKIRVLSRGYSLGGTTIFAPLPFKHIGSKGDIGLSESLVLSPTQTKRRKYLCSWRAASKVVLISEGMWLSHGLLPSIYVKLIFFSASASNQTLTSIAITSIAMMITTILFTIYNIHVGPWFLPAKTRRLGHELSIDEIAAVPLLLTTLLQRGSIFSCDT